MTTTKTISNVTTDGIKARMSSRRNAAKVNVTPVVSEEKETVNIQTIEVPVIEAEVPVIEAVTEVAPIETTAEVSPNNFSLAEVEPVAPATPKAIEFPTTLTKEQIKAVLSCRNRAMTQVTNAYTAANDVMRPLVDAGLLTYDSLQNAVNVSLAKSGLTGDPAKDIVTKLGAQTIEVNKNKIPVASLIDLAESLNVDEGALFNAELTELNDSQLVIDAIAQLELVANAYNALCAKYNKNSSYSFSVAHGIVHRGENRTSGTNTKTINSGEPVLRGKALLPNSRFTGILSGRDIVLETADNSYVLTLTLHGEDKPEVVFAGPLNTSDAAKAKLTWGRMFNYIRETDNTETNGNAKSVFKGQEIYSY